MASGKILLRMDEQLHEKLQMQAHQEGVSINDLCCIRIEMPSVLETLPSEIVPAMRIAKKICGNDLLGLVLFGSWARGKPSDSSDLDLLIVQKSQSQINRALYRKWQVHADEFTICEPHFVALPQREDHVTGLWAEIAVDGIILLDSDLQLREYLLRVRRLIVEGKLVSRKIHGQNYWVHTEVA